MALALLWAAVRRLGTCHELEMALALDGQKLVPLEVAAAGTGNNGRATDPGGSLESNRPVYPH